MEPRHLLVGVAEIFTQDLAVVLTQKRRLEIGCRWTGGKTQRRLLEIKLAQDAVAHFSHGATMAQMWMVHRLLYR